MLHYQYSFYKRKVEIDYNEIKSVSIEQHSPLNSIEIKTKRKGIVRSFVSHEFLDRMEDDNLMILKNEISKRIAVKDSIALKVR